MSTDVLCLSERTHIFKTNHTPLLQGFYFASVCECVSVVKLFVLVYTCIYMYIHSKVNIYSKHLSLDSFILSLCVVCLPVCVKIVQKIVKQLRTQTLYTVVMEFPEIRSSILVHTISEISHTSNIIVVFVCVYPK